MTLYQSGFDIIATDSTGNITQWYIILNAYNAFSPLGPDNAGIATISELTQNAGLFADDGVSTSLCPVPVYPCGAGNVQSPGIWTIEGETTAPTNLKATQPGSVVAPNGDQIILTWNYGSNPISGFEIDRKAPSGNWTPLTTVPSGSVCSPSPSAPSSQVCVYIDTTVPSFSTVSYRLRAFQGANQSANSNTATAYQLKTVTLGPSGSVIPESVVKT